MPDFSKLILSALGAKGYQPMKPKALAKSLGVNESAYTEFRNTLRKLISQGRAILGKNSTIRAVPTLPIAYGKFIRMRDGSGMVKTEKDKTFPSATFVIPDHLSSDASTGDTVQIAIRRKPTRYEDGSAEVIEVVHRAQTQFAGTFFIREEQSLVKVENDLFPQPFTVVSSIEAQAGDRVIIEVVKFPQAHEFGKAVVIEVLGKQGDPLADTESVIRSLGIPADFPQEALAEARAAVAQFREDDLLGREDYTQQLVLTIDPINARDHDDAIALTRDPKTQHWILFVHIADVAHFVPAGGPLDREARKRGTSVYLPDRVIPMFPEAISNHLASLKEGVVRYVFTTRMEFTPQGALVSTRFSKGAIRVRKSLTYEQVSEVLNETVPNTNLPQEIIQNLREMNELAQILRARRKARGSVELHLPEAVIDYDTQGHISGAHFARHDQSHQLIEEFMLANNVAIAQHLDRLDIPFLRRIHPPPDPERLRSFAQFVKGLGYSISRIPSRPELQQIAEQSLEHSNAVAVHYALLRSLRHASYTPEKEEHFALAFENYCHFTSPIRRYPDLLIHRQMNTWLRTRSKGADLDELRHLGELCSKAERRAEQAEREAVLLRILAFLQGKEGIILDAIITSVHDFGFFVQGVRFPAEGLVKLSQFHEHFSLDEENHTLEGKRTGRTFRLGDTVKVQLISADMNKRQIDFRIAKRGEKSDL